MRGYSIITMFKKYYDKYRRFARRVNKWQRSDDAKPILEIDPTHHVCENCGEQFVGRFCTQCGKPAARKRFTFKNVILNALEIWGFGSRPMFRTIAQLFTRPGYMIRDYLNGHYLRYFPPFKMLVVITLILMVIFSVLDIKEENITVMSPNVEQEILAGGSYNDNDTMKIQLTYVKVAEFFDSALKIMKQYPIPSTILRYIFLILSVKIFFRKSGYNLSELFISHVYIASQMQILAIIVTIVTMSALPMSLLPHNLPEDLFLVFLTYDYHQLFDRKWWPTIWRTICAVATSILFNIAAIIIIFASVTFFYIKYPS